MADGQLRRQGNGHTKEGCRFFWSGEFYFFPPFLIAVCCSYVWLVGISDAFLCSSLKFGLRIFVSWGDCVIVMTLATLEVVQLMAG